MDYDNITGPLGMAAALNVKEQTRAGQEGMTESEKEHFILKYKDARNQEERDKLMNSLTLRDDINDLFDGPSIG